MQAKRKVYHVVHKNGHWVLKRHNQSRQFETKKDAVAKGRKLAKPYGQLIVHKKNNVIQIEFTYGHDPRSRKG